jgi:hypothetical protein
MQNDQFITWWMQYRTSPKIPADLKEMEDHFIQSGLVHYSSNFWNVLNSMNIQQITDFGYENFKQTVTKNYFTWVVSLDHPYAQNLKHLVPNLTIDIQAEEMGRMHSMFTAEESLRYNTITLIFLELHDKHGGTTST